MTDYDHISIKIKSKYFELHLLKMINSYKYLIEFQNQMVKAFLEYNNLNQMFKNIPPQLILL